MNIYLISDCHLKFSESSEARQQQVRIIDFIKSVENDVDLLILNGDIFDLWFSWKKVIIKHYFPFLKKLADLKEKGCRVVFIAGNHDFWFGDFFRDYLNIEIYQDSFSETIDGNRIFVSHGDLYTANDLRYRIYRRIVRCKLMMGIFSLIHPDLALNIGKRFSRSSRMQKISEKLRKIREKGLQKSAKEKLQDYDLVIFGHSHSPQTVKFDKGLYINSGDWLENNTYLKISDGKSELIKYKEKE